MSFYKIYAVTVNPKTHKVQRELLLLGAEYEFNQALDVVDTFEADRDHNAKFGTIRNPLRFEAASPVGTAARF